MIFASGSPSLAGNGRLAGRVTHLPRGANREDDLGVRVRLHQLLHCRRWNSDPSGKCSYERPTRGTVCGTMRSMCSAAAGCLAINYQSLLHARAHAGVAILLDHTTNS